MIDNVKEILNKLIKANKVVSIFSDYDNKEKCTVGFIKGFDDVYVLIICIDVNGEYDGIALRKLDCIYRIDFDGIYETKIHRLYELKNEENCEFLFNKSIDIFGQLIKYAISYDKVIEISIDEDNEQELIVGTVNSYNEDKIVYIKKINSYGENDGITIINEQDTVTLNCDSRDARDLQLLNKKIR